MLNLKTHGIKNGRTCCNFLATTIPGQLSKVFPTNIFLVKFNYWFAL
jgi:hypothetical protein